MGADPIYVRHSVKTDRRGPDECWPWIGGTINHGYGYMSVTVNGRARMMLAHRIAWEEVNGLIPAGLVLDHTCHDSDVCAGGDTCPHRLCQNPAHLEPVTLEENKRRGLKSTCAQGHAMPENRRPRAKGGCAVCHREKQAVRNAARRGGQ